MLCIKISDSKKLIFELDPFILSIKLNNINSINSSSIYYTYKTYNSDALIEIEFNDDIGCFLSLTLVNSDGLLQKVNYPLKKNYTYKYGLPCIKKLKNTQIITKNLKLFLGDDYLTFCLNSSLPVEYFINDILRFGLDKNGYIVTIDLINLTKKQVYIIKHL